MTLLDTHKTTMNSLDMKLLSSANERVLLDESRRAYKKWYALLLGSIAMTTGDEEVVFAHLAHDAEVDSARILVFTPTLLTVADITQPSLHDAAVRVRTVPRRRVRALGLEIGHRHDLDEWGRRLQTWPGTITFTVEHRDLPEPLVFSALSHDPYRLERPADSLVLLEGLRRDLAGA